jgi:hypothetical protein
MRRILCLVLTTLLVLSLMGCGRISSTMEITCDTSQIYSTNDIHDAMDVVKQYFRRQFDGCTMTELGYAGDEKWKAMKEWADQYDADADIVLVSAFETNSRGGDGSMAANETYRNYQWVLVRNSNGEWEHKTHGYG